jgi:Group II intron, maturase-specific domain
MTRIKRLRATHRKTRLLNHVHAVWQLVGRTIWRSVRGKHRAATFDCRDEARSADHCGCAQSAMSAICSSAGNVSNMWWRLPNLAEMYNPCFRGWINYYSNFYRTQLRSTLKRIDLYVIRWARRKFKRLRLKTKGARNWFDRLRRTNPTLFAHWQLCHGNGRASGAV